MDNVTAPPPGAPFGVTWGLLTAVLAVFEAHGFHRASDARASRAVSLVAMAAVAYGYRPGQDRE